MSGVTSLPRRLTAICLSGILIATLNLSSAGPVFSADAAAQQQIVDKAQLTLEAFASDGQLKDSFKQLSKEARALFIIPQFMRGAFVFGGAGGSGVLIARDEKTGKWGDPVFYNIGSASFGLQITLASCCWPNPLNVSLVVMPPNSAWPSVSLANRPACCRTRPFPVSPT